MDQLRQIISLVQLIYNQCEEMKYCQKQSHVHGLLQPLQMLQAQAERNLPTEITTALKRFQAALEEAKEWIDKFSNKSRRHDRILFTGVNKRLRDVWEEFSLLLQVDQQMHISSISPGAFWQQEDQRTAHNCQISPLHPGFPTYPWIAKSVQRSLMFPAFGRVRLHHLETPAELHRNISSTSFLVTKDCNVKRLENVYNKYDIKAEIYNFGIVLWEIAPGKSPFEGCDSKKIYQLVAVDRHQKPVDKDCPSQLQEIIDDCCAYEPSRRPCVKGRAFSGLKSMGHMCYLTFVKDFPYWRPKKEEERVLAADWDCCPIGAGRGRNTGWRIELLRKWLLAPVRREFFKGDCNCSGGLASLTASFRLQTLGVWLRDDFLGWVHGRRAPGRPKMGCGPAWNPAV
ncbi:hypothetical protein EI555_012900 [Monodon monoceros]|uniref:Protein kinase domain-containing protein n=1 Tax=Monodon monoceros TaxID=40151 RepID=A0A4U1EI20_MONMO|nr:hypothetical protein EI555_012900 [Monodon monoceros]